MGLWDRKVLVVDSNGNPVAFGGGGTLGTVDQGNRGTQPQAWYVDPSGVTSPVSIANGLDAAQGATTDAEATGNGSIIAILKRLRTIWTSVWDSTNNWLNINLKTLLAGEDSSNNRLMIGRTAAAADTIIETLQNAQAAAANGSSAQVTGYSRISFNVVISGTITVTFQASGDNQITWNNIACRQSSQQNATSLVLLATASGLFVVPEDWGGVITHVRAVTSSPSGSPSATVTSLKALV